MALPPVITYGGRPISEGVDLHIEPDPRYDHTTPHRTATYGDYGGVEESDNLKARCEVEISYSNISYVINNDNSITVSGNITGGILRRTFVASSTNHQEITVRFNGQQTFHNFINTDQAGSWDLNIPHSFSVTIPPSNNPQKQYPAAIYFKNHNTGSTLPPDEWELGIEILNPNPPDYRPGAILDGNGVWQSHNRSAGDAHILTTGGTWRQLRTDNGLAAMGNPPSIRYQNAWHNQRRLGKE